ncbi:Tetratricopeptide-like helical domain superfamily [Sesbania bispinosa]|nr:Tetratricopeptide-like helical domain superfamily [Sesbania bispinosa]
MNLSKSIIPVLFEKPLSKISDTDEENRKDEEGGAWIRNVQQLFVIRDVQKPFDVMSEGASAFDGSPFAAEIRLIPVKEYMKLTYQPVVGNLKDIAQAYCDSFCPRDGDQDNEEKVPEWIIVPGSFVEMQKGDVLNLLVIILAHLKGMVDNLVVVAELDDLTVGASSLLFVYSLDYTRNGPSLMPGGSFKAYKYIEDILLKVGIEYSDMQLIAEAYDVKNIKKAFLMYRWAQALYRRAQAYIETGDYVLADVDIKKAPEVDPQNRERRD